MAALRCSERILRVVQAEASGNTLLRFQLSGDGRTCLLGQHGAPVMNTRPPKIAEFLGFGGLIG
jgi:hypothetical protein